MATDQPLIHVLVLNWNGADEAIECLHSIGRQSYPNLTPFVVDNGSVDDSVEQLRSVFPDLDIVCNEENLGFAGGVNVGLRHAMTLGADYVLVLNNDLILEENCIAELVDNIGDDIAFVMAAIYYTDDPQRIWSIGGTINRLNLEKTADARGQLNEGQFPDTIEREFVPGGATLMSCRALQEIGLFDENFFLYYEDADLSLRAHRLGYRSVIAMNARMWHGVSKSSGGADSPRERYWMARSSVRYFAKHAQLWQWPIILFWRSGSAVRTSWRLVSNGNRPALNAYWRGLRDGIRDLGEKGTATA